MAEEHTPTFAERLRRSRRAAGLSQEGLAERAGLSARAISALERGVNRSPRRDTLDMLADALDLSYEERQIWESVRRSQAVRSPLKRSTTKRRRTVAPLTNLPLNSTRFFGRGDELALLTSMLREPETRFVTLTGPGGSGKTRLALQVAGELIADYPDGVFFVDLAPITDPNLALATIAATLGLRPRADQAISTTLIDWLGHKRLLLLLDNLEQILNAAPDIGELLQRTSALQLLATSRAPLRLRAEQEFPVPPLPLPPSDATEKIASVSDFDVVRFFIDRARAVQPAFDANDEDARIVARICRQLDGLPLAIELVAACVRLFPPRAILTRLEQRLPLIERGPRDAPARQRTLSDTIAWSYALLAPHEQILMRRLSLFKGGWTMEAAEIVGGEELSGGGAIDVLQVSATLLEHNLMQVHEELHGSPRFSMLETIREFGLVQLEASGELQIVHQRHLTYFTRLFNGSERDWHTQRAETWLQCGDAEIENVRLALDWAIAHAPETALRLASAFSWIWSMRGAYQEARHRLERALATAGDIPDDLRAGTLWWVGAYATTRGDDAKARAALEEALAIYVDLNNEARAARCLHALGRIAMFAGDADRAVSLYESAADLLRQHRDPSLTVTLSNLGTVLLSSGKLSQAAAVLNEALDHAEREGLAWHRAMVLEQQGRLALACGDLSGGRRALRRCIQLHRDVQDKRFLAEALETCAWLATVEGKPAHAAQLLGAVSRIREDIGVPIPPSLQVEYDSYEAIARTQAGAAEWERAWYEGRTLSAADVIDTALQELA